MVMNNKFAVFAVLFDIEFLHPLSIDIHIYGYILNQNQNIYYLQSIAPKNNNNFVYLITANMH